MRPCDGTATCAVVGLGYWGPNLLRVLNDIPSVDVAWICDLDPRRLERFSRRHPAARTTSRLEDVLEDPRVDAVVIATPVFSHHALAGAALAAGKHVFVEKPLAPSSDLADELLSTADSSDLVLMCGHTFLYSPAVSKVKQLIDDRALGGLLFVTSSRVNLGLHQRDVSVVWDLGPHDFSILLHWLGEVPDTVRAVGRDSIVRGIPDVAFLTLSFPSGVIANVELSWLAPSKLRRTVVVGTDKMVVYEDGTPEPIRVFDHGVVYRDPETFGEYHLSYRTGDILSPKLDGGEPLAAEMTDFVDAVLTGRSMRHEARLARNVVCVAEAAEASLRLGGVEQTIHGTRTFQEA
jgi:predicted dehydrogenase